VGLSIDSLPPEERSRRYRELADAAFYKATQTKDPKLHSQYLGLAMGWHAMALELEAHLRHLTQLEASQARLRKIGKEVKPHQ